MIAPTEIQGAVESDVAILDKPYDRISWGAIIAGSVTALSMMLVLSLIGIGIGLSALDPQGVNPSGAAIGIGAVVWWTISNLASLFVGGMVAGRTAGTFNGALHGFITWASVTVLTVMLLSGTMGRVFSGVTGLAQFASQVSPELGQQAQRAADTLQNRAQPGANPNQPAPSEPAARQPNEAELREAGEKVATGGAIGTFGAALALILGAIAAILGGKSGRAAYFRSVGEAMQREPVRHSRA